MRENQAWPKLGDQGFLHEHIGDAAKWQDTEPVYSYKVHCKGKLPADAKVVCFHGKPRPWTVRDRWIPPLHKPVTMRDFRELILAHKGKRICVMGGGPLLAEEIGKVEADVYISTNAHGVELRKPDYLLAMDELYGKGPSMGPFMRAKSDAPIISPHSYADFRLGAWPQNPRFVLSGMIAAWTAWVMGAKVVILAGFDAYGGDKGYVREAVKISKDIHCPVRVVDGALTQVWPKYEPAEKFGRYTPSTAIEGLRGVDGVIKVRVHKPCTVGWVDLERGQEVSAFRHEVARLLRHRMVEEIS
jgi:hypothetical protein